MSRTPRPDRFDVQYGPNGVQWCSDALLEAIAEASARTGRRVHMHLLETRYQRAFADANYPDGIVKHLDCLGLLSSRLTLAHCVWARPEELDLLAVRGVTLVNNNSSNLHLRSGMAPVARMVERGCRVALGIDGSALDEDDDSLRELRLAHLLHVGTGFKTVVSRQQALRMAFGNGRFSVTNVDDGGAIVPGAPADLLLLDWAALDDDRLVEAIDPLDLLVFARDGEAHPRADRRRPHGGEGRRGARRRSAGGARRSHRPDACRHARQCGARRRAAGARAGGGGAFRAGLLLKRAPIRLAGTCPFGGKLIQCQRRRAR